MMMGSRVKAMKTLFYANTSHVQSNILVQSQNDQTQKQNVKKVLRSTAKSFSTLSPLVSSPLNIFLGLSYVLHNFNIQEKKILHGKKVSHEERKALKNE